jgi:hypothetical protein
VHAHTDVHGFFLTVLRSTNVTCTTHTYTGIQRPEIWSSVAGTVHVFRQDFALEDAIGSHACSLEALTCVWPMAFLSGVH